MLFKKEILLKSNYPVEVLFDRLEKSMVFDIKNPTSRKFRGKVNRDSSTFLISQPEYGTERNSMRPEINGLLEFDASDKITIVKLLFILPKSISYLIVTLLILNVAFGALLFFIDGLMEPNFKDAFIFIAPVGLALFIIIANYSFKVKTSEAIDDLSFIFGAREI